MDIVSEWADYNNIHPTQCYSTAPKERYRNILTIEGGALQLCMLNDWGMNPANSWIDYLKTMNLKVYQKVSNYPLAGRDAYFLFYDFSQNRDTAFPNNWANNNSFGQWLINDNGTTIESVFYNRSRYEDNVPPVAVQWSLQSTPFNWNNAGGASASWISANNINTNWSDKDIWFHYQFVFELSWLPT
ncbi:MAG: hypothetical protein ACKOPP_02540, partial [Bacteroidota bacterium]